MEMANEKVTIRTATMADAPALTDLLRRAAYRFTHVDWSLPGEWLGSPSFAVAEAKGRGDESKQRLVACFAVGADPPPAAWVRVAAVESNFEALAVLRSMATLALGAAKDVGVTQVGFLPSRQWPHRWLRALGFRQTDQVITYVKSGLNTPADVRYNHDVVIRSVRAEDIPQLVHIEEQAFSPLWRHSAKGLQRGWQNAISFDVAHLGGHVVGFQYSAHSESRDTGHLVRLTVSPDAQGMGVGGALLATTVDHYRALDLRSASLNTQASNVASQRLYERFGFERIDYSWPVWRIDL